MIIMNAMDLLYCATCAALAAGKDILEVYHDPNSDFGIEKKADNSPLTRADKKAHERIVSFLQQTPYPILSEEGRHMDYAVRKEWDTLWIVDPLDGTKEFIKKNGEFTVNIALVKNGTPVLGVIYVPVKEDLYIAEEQAGAFKLQQVAPGYRPESMEQLLAQAVRLPMEQPEKQAFVIVASRSHLTPETEEYIRMMESKHEKVETRSSGSSIKICLVAEGAADVYPRFAPTMEWDTAAGHAIVRAAGKNIWHTDLQSPLQYNKEDLLNPWFIVQ